jgi:class 3 adenylate cyclase/cold shock CspA family protein
MPENRQLRDTFADPASRQYRTVVAIDMVNSTAMKEQQPEASWLTSLGWMYDKVTEIGTQAASDVIIKYNGDGIMLVFDTSRTTEAVNAAVRIQEAISKASTGNDGRKGAVDFTCSAGITAGEVVVFATPGGNLDVVGTVVDKAFRLCAAANSRAIFVDRPAVGAANMILIQSSLGNALNPRRTPEQYQGDLQRAVLDGFNQPVEYYEILWDQQLYGMRSKTMTDSTDRFRTVPLISAAPAERGLAPKPPSTKSERHRGTITVWRPDREFGFVRDEVTDEDFHFSPRALIYPDDTDKLAPGKEVVFVATGTGEGGRHRSAAGLLLVGEPAEGRLAILPQGRPYGWIRVDGDNGDRHLIYAAIEDLTGYQPGDALSFTVGGTDRGGCAREIERIEEQKAA